MSDSMKILITGAVGFIPSCVAQYLYKQGHELILVDNFNFPKKNKNITGLNSTKRIERMNLFNWLEEKERNINFVFHLGARTDTTEFNRDIFDKLNVQYSKDLWMYCALEKIPLIYASSAATYGMGEHGFDDSHEIVDRLQPLNPYGESKNEFDKWALKQFISPPSWFGFKFFNVFGPNEYHKGRMASVVFHFYHQINKNKSVKLFQSHREEVAHGEQTRDFIYIEDLVSVLDYFKNNYKTIENGLYNLGTSKARTYNDLANAIFTSMDIEPNIEYIETPEDIRSTYQYFTEAAIDKLRIAGYDKDFYTLESSIDKYITEYLSKENATYRAN